MRKILLYSFVFIFGLYFSVSCIQGYSLPESQLVVSTHQQIPEELLKNTFFKFRKFIFWSVFLGVISQLLGTLLWSERRRLSAMFLGVSTLSFFLAIGLRIKISVISMPYQDAHISTVKDSLQLVFVLVVITAINIGIAKYINLIHRKKEQALRHSVAKLKELNQVKENYAKQLERDVELRTQEINAQAERLRQQTQELKTLDAAKSRFFACISHEFRTPITLIKGPLIELKKAFSQYMPSEGMLNLDLAIKNSERLELCVEQILDLCKLQAKNLEILPKAIDGRQWLSGVISNFAFKAKQKNIHLVSEYKKDLVLSADDSYMDKVMYNLIGNAIKFSPQGGTIVIAMEESGTFAKISVTDNGIGMTEVQVKHCFELFYQAPKESYYEGSGIGLTFAKEIVEIHRGSMTVESELGKGATFTVLLPKSIVDKPAIAPVPLEPRGVTLPRSTTSISNESKPTVLLVEDDEDMRQFILAGLGRDYNVKSANNGEEALLHIKEDPPDLVLTDWLMPVMDGMTLLHSIREDTVLNTLPVVIITGSAGDKEKKQGYASLADDYLTKPFDMEDLTLRLNAIIKIRRLIKEVSNPNGLGWCLSTDQADVDMLTKIDKSIEDNISDPLFDCEALAQSVFMTPKTLSRHLEKLTNFTPGLYIRHKRLLKAKQLSDAKVYKTKKEIAFAVGFKNAGYFSRLFREQFSSDTS